MSTSALILNRKVQRFLQPVNAAKEIDLSGLSAFKMSSKTPYKSGRSLALARIASQARVTF
jgi:hypothetical protein